ncbi:hypothetical protein [Kutzneria buriramensis]|uniref:Uncharacterized protein n=1 Tax=Kutzneria buriramensis TaxID=1045776 RepID=A0A3E0G7G7_9PSEU|nr:hypothetical protein [Kutzneria buriramensis]REH18285.1 hypothetical protein BCF44_13640 [Kutzneria buriramensis]
MTTTEPAPTAVFAAQRLECVACCRPYGRRRAPLVDGDALFDCADLVVCDQCWHLAGGADAVQTALAGDDGPMEPLLVFDPAFEQLLVAADEYDQLHPIDRFLVESGIRWSVLRYITVPARCDLVRWVLERVPPAHTRPTDSPAVWIEAVEARIREQTGDEFKYNAKRRRWWRIANVLRCCSDRGRRPLTWVAQEEIAAAVGCSTRTVRRCVAWLQREGLLFEVLPGCQLPQMVAPDGETAEERADRDRRMAAAIAAEQAAMARAEAELDAVRAGLLGDQAAAAAEAALSPEEAAALAAVDDLEPGLVQLAPVYELRVPVSEAEQAEEAAISRAHTVLRSPGEQLLAEHQAEQVHPANVLLYSAVTVVHAGGGHAVHDPLDLAYLDPSPICPDCGPVVGYLRGADLGADLHKHQNGHPPQVCWADHLKSSSVQPVDKGRASPGSDMEELSSVSTEDSISRETSPDLAAEPGTAPAEGDHPKARQSEAVRAAEWLLRSRLHPVVCDDVSVRWLAAQIRGSHLLDRWDWTWDDLADLLHGFPENTHLPRFIRSARAWIRARFQRATPALSPSKLKIIREIERTSPALRGRHQAEAEHVRQAEIAARRAAVAACGMCDELGWLHVPDGTPTVRCNHDPDTSGW